MPDNNSNMKKKNRAIGLLGLQGAFRDHIRHLEALGVRWRVVRDADDLPSVERLIIPGGESTVMARYLKRFSLVGPLKKRMAEGMPVWGICAGAILLAESVDGGPGLTGALPIKVSRNAYGRQIASFQAGLDVPKLSLSNFPAIFIRAPRIIDAGSGAAVLARLGGDPVFVQAGAVMATTFHPELGKDPIFHRYFLAVSKPAST